MTRHDLLIVGGGPAGCAAALHASALGLSVGLLWAPDRWPRAAESLPPAGRRLLVELGCWPAFSAAGWPASSGVRSVWGSTVPVDRDSIRDPDGPGWLLDRSAFDAFLRARVAGSGALLQADRLVAVRRTAAGYDCRTATGAVVSGRFLLDASGRSASAASRLGARRRYDDDSVATVWSYRPAAADTDRRTSIEAAPDGWWYSIRASDRLRTVGRIGLPDEPPGAPPPGIGAMLAGAPTTGPARRVAANSGFLAPAVGDGWAAAGDAALSFDPLSSQGILTALFAGRAAAEAAAGWLAADPAALAAYAGRLAAIRQTYQANLAAHYGSERRWPDARFWAARASRQPAGA